MKHTAELTYNPELNRVSAIDNGGCKVTRCIPFGGSPEEVIANGYLFAAAPEMFSLIKSIYEALLAEKQKGTRLLKDEQEWFIRAVELIAKIEGREG